MSKVSISSPRVLNKPKRPGVHCKNKSSKIKTSKNYRKKYRGQGK